MTPSLPRRLSREPLVEAIWEMRFDSAQGAPLGDLLPGILYQEFRDVFPNVVRLPAADIPRPIVTQDERLRYAPTLRFEGGPGEHAALALQVGERVVSLNCRRPYLGWAVFRQRIADVVRYLPGLGLLDRPERFSLRYLDLVDLNPQPSLAGLATTLRLADLDLTQRPVQMRTELDDEGLVSIIQVASAAEARLEGAVVRGVLIDIDVICADVEGFWSAFEERLERVHDRSKRLFFSLLAPETIDRLGPVYE